MKDETKEILDILKNKECYINDDITLNINETKLLLDYITNLQEENNNLKEDFKRHIDRINELTERNGNLQEEKEDYKSRNEKANNILKDTSVDMPETLLIETIDYARHILNGGDDNETR